MQATHRFLEFQTTSLILDHKLENRKTISELLQYNIIKGGSLAPNIQANSHMLRWRRISERLDYKLERRPKPRDLVLYNIIRGEDILFRLDALGIDVTESSVESITTFKNALELLEQKISTRPDARALIDKEILKAPPSFNPKNAQTNATGKQKLDKLNSSFETP